MAAAIKPRNGKREYTDEVVRHALEKAKEIGISNAAYWLDIPRHTISTWKYGPRGERVRGR